MDVSPAVDMLFEGAVPERVDELKALWGERAERVRLLDTPRFLLALRDYSGQRNRFASDLANWLRYLAGSRGITCSSQLLHIMALRSIRGNGTALPPRLLGITRSTFSSIR